MADTIEIVTFNLQNGASRDDFLEKNIYVEENLVSKMPGFKSRQTAVADDGQVAVILHWEKPESAQNSMDKFVDAPESQDFQKLIDMDTFQMVRYVQVR
jgi:heme-degrading monooxygenase HmoA